MDSNEELESADPKDPYEQMSARTWLTAGPEKGQHLAKVGQKH